MGRHGEHRSGAEQVRPQERRDRAGEATGIRLLGRHSKSSTSTARSTAAIGVLNVADIPPAAPATKRALRSAAVSWKVCAIIEPIEPPVMMIGPSAPKGPPEPIAIADEIGFNSATLGLIRLRPIEDRLHRLGDAVPTDSFRPITSHQPDDQAARDRYEHRPPTQMVLGRRPGREGEPAEVKQVREKLDQA